MNLTLTALKQKVQTWIRDKAVPDPDPALVKATDTAQIHDETIDYLSYLEEQIIGPSAPEGVRWLEAPSIEISGNSLDISTAQVGINDTIKNIAAASISVTLPASGFKIPFVVIANYDGAPAYYEIIEGNQVGENDSYVYPPVPESRLWVANFMVTNSGIIPMPNGAITTIEINGVTYVADATGKAVMQIDTGISNASELPYTPTETTWWQSILTAGKTKVNAALDFLATKVKGKADADDTILWFKTAKWFTPTGTFSTSGTTVTTSTGQFTAAMVGAKIGISASETDRRIITAYNSATSVTVDSAFSQNYSNVVAANWGVYSKAVDVKANGEVSVYSPTKAEALFTVGELKGYGLSLHNGGIVGWSATGPTGTKDAAFGRNAAGVIEVNNGTAGQLRDLLLRTLKATTVEEGGVSLTDKYLSIATPTTTGTTVTFATERTYGAPSSPVSGNITLDLTGMKNGVVCKMYHNSAVEPTINGLTIGNNSGAAKIYDTSDRYETSTLNVIYFMTVGTTEVEYFIRHRA